MSETEATPEHTRHHQSDFLLDDLHGMNGARAWGESLKRDLADFKNGLLTWQDVDRGALLCGPPGCGKTTFAKALAASCGVPLIVASYSKWQSTKSGHLGSVLKAMRKDFARATALSPAILFIDEIDAFPSRDDLDAKNREWWVSVMNALLEKMDGACRRDGVIVVGATNRRDSIDPALVRAGRLDRIIDIELPSPAALEHIFRLYLRDELASEALCGIAIAANGLSGADVEHIVRCARRAAREQQRCLALQDLFDQLDRAGQGRSQEMLWRAAVHEAGHAAIAIVLNLATEITMSLVQRRDAGGHTAIAMPTQSSTRDMLERRIACMLAGRAAEEVILGDVSAGAGGSIESDLAQATELATKMVTSFGLSAHQDLLYLDSPKKNRLLIQLRDVRQEVQAILDAGYQQAGAVIRTYKTQVCKLAHALVVQRALSDADVRELLAMASEPRKRPRRQAIPKIGAARAPQKRSRR